MLCYAAQEMRVWPLGADFKEQASNHLKMLWSMATLVSVKEKSRNRIVAGVDQGSSVSEPLMRCRNVMDNVKTRVLTESQDKSRANLLTTWVASGIKVAGT
jgi:hypothetical protein